VSGLLSSAANYANANPETLALENERTESPDASPSFLEGLELYSEAGSLGFLFGHGVTDVVDQSLPAPDTSGTSDNTVRAMQIAGTTVSQDAVPAEPFEQPDQITLQVTPAQVAPTMTFTDTLKNEWARLRKVLIDLGGTPAQGN
jgi:hypothetical protein